jgi:predicted transcriptional regulator
VKTGVPQPQIARIESGAVSPRMDTLERLMTGAGVTLEVSPRIGQGVDRSLIRESLARSPEARVQAAETAARNLADYLAETRTGSSR